jgi:predicted HNH restriction endonuclease
MTKLTTTMTALFFDTNNLSYLAIVGHDLKTIGKKVPSDSQRFISIGTYSDAWTKKDIARFHLRKVAIAAHQFLKHDPTVTTKSEAFKKAWKFVRENPCVRILKFKKVSGIEASRLIDCNVDYQIKGTGRPLKPGQKMYVDVIRSEVKGRAMYLSTYQNNIIELL